MVESLFPVEIAPGVALRRAGPADAGILLELVREFARYERLDPPVATEALMAAALKAEPPHLEALLLEEAGSVAGFVVLTHNFSCLWGRRELFVEDLFVRDAYRGKGYGLALMRGACRIAKARNCVRMQWVVLDWNETARRFYAKIGATAKADWVTYRLEEENFPMLMEDREDGEDVPQILGNGVK